MLRQIEYAMALTMNPFRKPFRVGGTYPNVASDKREPWRCVEASPTRVVFQKGSAVTVPLAPICGLFGETAGDDDDLWLFNSRDEVTK